jgi:malate synthase
VVTKALFRQMLAEEQEVVRGEVGRRWQSGRFAEASALMDRSPAPTH